MAKLKKIRCPYCEGTGKKINEFDPPDDGPLWQRIGITPEVKEITFSGRRIEEGVCPYCNGTLEVYDI